MERMKRLVSLVLCFVMVIGLLPMGVLAQEDGTLDLLSALNKAQTLQASGEVIDAAIFCSDLHGNTSSFATVFSAAKSNDSTFNPSTASFVGDTDASTSTVTANAQKVFSNVECIFAYGSHDSGYVTDFTGVSYGANHDKNYYIYTISQSDMESSSPSTSGFTSAVASMDKTKPLFILSHMPLHARRGDNKGASAWYSAISAAAEQMDIVFFWAHNHTGESSTDTAAYYVAKDGNETMSIQGGTKVTPNFTYMNAGYIDANGQSPERKPVATTVKIYADALVFQDYTTSGAYTDSSYSHNVEVAREFAGSVAAPVLESVAIEGETTYYVGDELDLTVTATYDDGTTADVTDKATFDNDLSASGTYTVTATYTEGDVTKTASADVKVYLYAEDENNLTGVQVFSQGATGLTVTWDDAAEAYLGTIMDDYVVYDLALTNAGATSEYAMTIVDGMDTSNLVVYHVAEDGTLTKMDAAIEGDCVVFTTSLAGTFAYGSVSVPEGYVLDSLMVSNAQTDYLVGQTLDLTGGFAVSAVYTMDGAEDFVRTLYAFEENNNPDGYEVNMDSFDMTAAGSYNVEITYGGKSVTFPIHVWGDCFTAGDVTVALDNEGEEYGVTGATVSDSTNANVAAAVADVLEGDNYKAYDISLIYAENYAATDDVKTVTLPIPEGVVNPAVYFVPETGAAEPVTIVNKTDSTVSFETDHFSTYVIGESTEITVPDPETATGSGTTTTTVPKDVYVLVSTPTAGNQYIIVNRNSAGSGYALKENTTTGSSITVNAAGNGISAPYIETTDETIMWNTASGMTFQSENGGYYLRYSSGLKFSTSNSTNWTYSNNRLRCSVSSNWGGNTYYYLRYNSGWSASTSQSSVYFYEKQTISVETTTTVSGTYSIAGNPAEVTKVVKSGSTVDLGSTLTFVPTSGETTTTDTSATATYTVVEGGDPNGVISGISGNIVTFSGKIGKALVKVSYEVSFGTEKKTVTNYIVVNASEPYYSLDIMKGDSVVTGTTIPVKGVKDTTTLQLGTAVKVFDGTTEDGESYTLTENDSIEWHIPEEYQGIATVDHDTGLVSFKGVNGAFYVTATLHINGEAVETVGVNISATTSSYSVPTDGTSDFPEYPDEGAIRFDKNATAVGNFSQTGIAQVELSMTGVPYTTGSEIDVVLMLDMTGSMDDVTSSTSKPTGYVRIDATIAASKAFIDSIVKNEDGSYNKNRIGVYVFNKNGAATLFDFGTVDNDDELEAIYGDLESIKDDHFASGGTPYDDGLGKCYEVLKAAKTDGVGNNRQQFTVFMTDGVPTSYEYINGTSHANHSSASSVAGMLTSASDYKTRDTDYKYEYYSTEMKKAGVTVYSVGVGLFNENNAWSGSATQCGNLASALLNDISGPGGETTQPDGIGSDTTSKKDKYFFSVEDATAATDMEKVFSYIATEILQAATDLTVEDKITDEYTMIFDIPTGSKDITGVTNDFYIEFLKYTLDEEHERTGDPTSVTKLYLIKNNGTVSAGSTATTAYDAPVFEAKTIGDKGTLYYWTTDSSYTSEAAVSYESDDATYYFIPYGIKATDDGFDSTKWFNMTSGAYAAGNVNSNTNMVDDLVIATPYFVYNAQTRMLYWTLDKLQDATTEYALRYFLYLDDSATEVGTDKETDPGSYPTNEYAYLTYTNFKGNECRQEFPKPQLTWNGAQVSYVFYLVNAAGQPINKSGQVVDFANATFITDVYTKSVVWNKDGDTSTGTGELSAEWLASDLLPETYTVYDERAQFLLNVYENADGSTIKNQFTIAGSEKAAISASLNDRLNLETTANGVSDVTTKVYNTKSGEKIVGYGTYLSSDDDMKDIDFANLTVAFAVVWQPRVVDDVVVVDYGLDVLIDVVKNDLMQNTVSGIGVGTDAYGSTEQNTGVITNAVLTAQKLTLANGDVISIENENQIRYEQTDMIFDEAITFYYETPVEFMEGANPKSGFMYASVTVIPATNIYYEDEYVTLNTFVATGEDAEGNTTYTKHEGWAYNDEGNNSQDATATQDQDRPGKSQISKDIDADNNYGYDGAYETMSEYSMGSAAKVNVYEGKYATATFTFKGTGFDIISLTDNTTGTIVVKVYAGDKAEGEPVVSKTVNTYYGYAREYYDVTYTYTDGEWVATNETKLEAAGTVTEAPENPAEGATYTTCEIKWVTASNDSPNALYQVPVMKIGDNDTSDALPYGTYTAEITVSYISFFDKTEASGYDFYLDAIRIYNPTGNNDKTSNDAYVADGEGWPEYYEVRSAIIDANEFNSLTDDTPVSGIVFIDGAATDGPGDSVSISDYTSYGPNNELYLESGNAIAFDLNATASAGKVAKVQLSVKSVGGTGKVKIYSTDGTVALDAEIATATDMYYDITGLNGKTVIIESTGTAIISITNVKVTYTEAQPAAAEEAQVLTVRRSSVLAALETMNAENEVPEATEPEATEPEVTEPEVTEPEVTEPEETEPEETKPEKDPTAALRDTMIKVIKKLFSKFFG